MESLDMIHRLDHGYRHTQVTPYLTTIYKAIPRRSEKKKKKNKITFNFKDMNSV